MTHEDRPAGANVHYLEQGVDLIRRLNDETYSNSPESPYPGGVGAQFRHCLDFYDCFLRGLESGQIDYGRRERDMRVENDRHHAIARFQEVSEQLAALSAEHLERPVRVKAEDTARGAPEWGCSARPASGSFRSATRSTTTPWSPCCSRRRPARSGRSSRISEWPLRP